MNDLILVTIDGGFALCRVVTTLTPEQARNLGGSMVQATTPQPPPEKPAGPKPEVRAAARKRRTKKN
jgi:hypothetical protein